MQIYKNNGDNADLFVILRSENLYAMDKLFLIDAYAVIYRSYYALRDRPLRNSAGVNTSAVLGFCNTLLEVLQKGAATHVGVAFDPPGPTFRSEAYTLYKAQRPPAPEDIHASVPAVKRLLDALHIPAIEVAGFEADDVIGTLSCQAAHAGVATYMLTPDKDYAQLVRDGVYIYRPRYGGGYETLDTEGVKAKYGIATPAQMRDMLALIGDKADNIPGCRGVGEKTAATLLQRYGDVETLLQHTDELTGATRKKVEEGAEQIRFSKFLATIRTDVPVTLCLDALAVKVSDAAALRRFFVEMEFRNMAERFLGGDAPILNASKKTATSVKMQPDFFATVAADGADAASDAALGDVSTVAHSYQLVDNEADMKALSEKLSHTKSFCFDTETTSVDAIDAQLVGMSFATEEHSAYYVPVPPERAAAERVVDVFRAVLQDASIEKVGQNIKYDMQVLLNYGVQLDGPLFDTMIAHYLIQPEQRHNMDDMAETYLRYRTIHIDALIGKRGAQQRSMRDVPIADACVYAAEDADVTLQLRRVLDGELQRTGLLRLFRDVEMPLVTVLCHMERNGVSIDTKALADTSLLLTARMRDIEQRIYSLAGATFNIASPRQVGEMLFGRMKIVDKPKRTKTGQYVTGEDVLQQLRTRHPIVALILEHRALKKLLGTYVDTLPHLINPRTGHIHTSFNQAVTATGRLSSSNPNLQNIPVRGTDGKEIRRAFVPEQGCLFFSADYSQIELRILAHLSGDDNMIDAFLQSHDIHAATAARIYKKAIEEVTRDERTQAKRANFGIVYGITVFGLAEQLNISRDDARQLIDGYFASFPAVQRYIETAKAKARQQGYAETLFGRRRYLPDINSRNATVRGFAERNAVNAPIQGTAADIIKIAMGRIFRRFQEERLHAKMILQVHDELNFSVPLDERQRVRDIVVHEMEHAAALRVPLTVDSAFGNNWLEAH